MTIANLINVRVSSPIYVRGMDKKIQKNSQIYKNQNTIYTTIILRKERKPSNSLNPSRSSNHILVLYFPYRYSISKSCDKPENKTVPSRGDAIPTATFKQEANSQMRSTSGTSPAKPKEAFIIVGRLFYCIVNIVIILYFMFYVWAHSKLTWSKLSNPTLVATVNLI